MLRGSLGVVAVIVNLGSPAHACDCPFPIGLKTNEERQSYRFGQASTVATVRIENLNMAVNSGNGLIATSVASVRKKVKGTTSDTIRIVTFGGEEGANCGLASALFGAISGSRLLTAALEKDDSHEGTYWIGSCGFYELDSFGSAEQESSHPTRDLLKKRMD
ncbi:hypothetical protein [Methylobacterium sp. E-045]|uniref:hypothetical protein n=1 Tax=Methylobacterium sp. E-045 TaxID=2836575 RepID=UPI001FBA11E1|nr:hypothetical protein [Methylobacterium sp. E-045]MCJ2128136.1 hypothetical protein [Methylobacterium sp. E-045]